MRLLPSLVLLLHAHVGASPHTKFSLYENADAAHLRWNDTATFIGYATSSSSCQAACVARFGADPTTGCTAFTHYHAGHYNPKLASQCYGWSSGSWAPFYSDLANAPHHWGNVTSGQNVPHAFVTQCSSRADCSYNGHCTDGQCACYPQWMGKACGQLYLVPTPARSGLQSTDGGGRVSSWGGTSLRADDGTYHMYAAEMTHNTGIVVWMSNSRVRHAISTNGPDGPYTAADVAHGVWGHEPTAARAPTGEYVLYWTAAFGSRVPCSSTQCMHGDDGDTVVDQQSCLPDTNCTYRPTLSTYMSYASQPSGPWSTPVLVPSPPGFSGDTNLAPVIRADGSLIGLGRPPWIWRATDWRNLSTYAVDNAGDTIEGEDPFLYIDPRDPDVLHGLSHAGGWDSRGGHAWSVDGGKTWQRHDDVAAYGSLFMYDDGRTVSLSRRERPHLVFGADGLPSALVNGVTEAWPCTHPNVCPRDHCYTALQKLNQR